MHHLIDFLHENFEKRSLVYMNLLDHKIGLYRREDQYFLNRVSLSHLEKLIWDHNLLIQPLDDPYDSRN